VLLDGKPAFSCLTPVSEVRARAITTIEGLAAGPALHAVQEAFLAEDAYQCGYCTPGMILATVALLREKAQPTDAQILKALDGHLCRCCGYPRVLAAVRRAAGRAGA
jgi:aerobic-type carbon monoxide dehydrogenase small subunit (CoxS/CutS family)